MKPDTQSTIDALRVEAIAKRNNAKDIVAQADVLDTAASQLEGTLQTQITDAKAVIDALALQVNPTDPDAAIAAVS